MMGNIFGEDFKEFLLLLNKHQVEYLLIGGYTVILYGYPRTTGDLDVWIGNSNENRLKLIKACAEFGLMTTDLTTDKFNDPETEVFTFGRPPVCIELLIKVQGFEFDEAYKNAVIMEPDGYPVKVVSFPDLVKLKTNAGRPKDLDDLNNISERK
jgi:predicted nucleotidyltransferase